jgi:DnaJ like chaperone protein
MLRLVLFLLVAYVVVRGLRGLLPSFSPRAPASPSPVASRGERPPHIVLGVTQQATQDEIRAAYQRLVHENHPDRVATMSQEIRDLALARTQEINHAYDRLKRS